MKIRSILFIALLVFLFGCLNLDDKNDERRIPVININSESHLVPYFSEKGIDEVRELDFELHTKGPIIINNTNNTNDTNYEDDPKPIYLKCEDNYILEDGECVSKQDYDDFQSKSSNEKQEEDSQYLNETNEENESSKNNSISEEEFDELLSQIPTEFKETANNFFGNKEDFKKLLADLKNSDSPQEFDSFRDKLGKFKDDFDLSKLDPLLSSSLALSSAEGSGIGVSTFLSEAGNLVFSLSQIWNPVNTYNYSEPDYRVEKIETEWGNEHYINIYFKSYAAMYTYVVLAPLTLYIDKDNDGSWDIRYNVVYNENEGKAYFYIKKRKSQQVLSRELKYDVSNKKISFKLGSEISQNQQRIFFWIGEKNTGFRYPAKNDLVLYLSNGFISKNAVDYTLVLLDRLKVNDDGDALSEGEIFLYNQVLFSKDIDEIDSEEARRLVDYKNQGIIKEDEIPKWFAYWIYKGAKNTEGVEFQKTAFPVLKWVEMNDGDELFVDDTGKVISAFPIFSSRRESLLDSRIIFFSTIVGDYDSWPSTVSDKTGWLFAKLFDKALDGEPVAGDLIKGLVEWMYYKISGEEKSFYSIVKRAFTAIFRFLGSPDLIGSPSTSLSSFPFVEYNLPASNGNAEVVYSIRHVRVPTTPLNLTVKLKKIKIKDRSDGFFGEFYFYGRVCSDVSSNGLNNGISFSWPIRGKTITGNCTTEKLKHNYALVLDGDVVAKNTILASGLIRAVPFIYLELQGWEEDKENLGDDDDPMGLLTRVIPLDESAFSWEVESNNPTLHYSEVKNADKIKIYYEVEIN